jgi:hypothetical protein
MAATEADGFVSSLPERVRDELTMVIRYTEQDWEFLQGEAWYREWAAKRDMRTPEQMHRDGVSRHQQADMASDLYDNEVHADVRITEHGTGVSLYVSETSGVFLWVGPDADFSVPEDVETCLELARERSGLDAGGDDPE